MITINFTKAQDLTKDRLRIERKPLLEIQDIAFQRATEESKSVEAIVAEKQRLRDLPFLVDAAKTLEELKALKA